MLFVIELLLVMALIGANRKSISEIPPEINDSLTRDTRNRTGTDSVENARGAGTLACCFDTYVDVRPTPRRVSAQQTESPRHIASSSSPLVGAGPWPLPCGRGSVGNRGWGAPGESILCRRAITTESYCDNS